MIGALWAYDGWNNITFLAGEVKNPGRNLPLALIGGGLVVMGLYLFVNLSYFHVLTPTEVANVPASSSVAAEVVRRLLGFCCCNAYGCRNDDFIFRRAARVDPCDRSHTVCTREGWSGN